MTISCKYSAYTAALLKSAESGNLPKNFAGARFGQVCQKWSGAGSAGPRAEIQYVTTFNSGHLLASKNTYH